MEHGSNTDEEPVDRRARRGWENAEPEPVPLFVVVFVAVAVAAWYLSLFVELVRD